jgi:acyl-CoA synthetase (AMP-forming)/AMP-acid ligase II
VRLAEGAVLDESALASWARQHLAEYKVPDQFVVVDDLPRTGTNKVQKSELGPLFET